MPTLKKVARGSRSERVYAALQNTPGANRHALVHETVRLIHKMHNHPWNGRAGASVGLTINKALDFIADNEVGVINMDRDESEQESTLSA
jgi:hypothetical protein